MGKQSKPSGCLPLTPVPVSDAELSPHSSCLQGCPQAGLWPRPPASALLEIRLGCESIIQLIIKRMYLPGRGHPSRDVAAPVSVPGFLRSWGPSLLPLPAAPQTGLRRSLLRRSSGRAVTSEALVWSALLWQRVELKPSGRWAGKHTYKVPWAGMEICFEGWSRLVTNLKLNGLQR